MEKLVVSTLYLVVKTSLMSVDIISMDIISMVYLDTIAEFCF
jgi:hypothetical protein